MGKDLKMLPPCGDYYTGPDGRSYVLLWTDVEETNTTKDSHDITILIDEDEDIVYEQTWVFNERYTLEDNLNLPLFD